MYKKETKGIILKLYNCIYSNLWFVQWMKKVVVRFLEPIIDGTPGSEALGENCVSDQVWLTKSLCVVEAVVV